MPCRSVLFILGFSLILGACMPLETNLPAKASANPTAALPPGASPTSPLQQVSADAGTAPAFAPQPVTERWRVPEFFSTQPPSLCREAIRRIICSA
jgi:hypothetical protein